jgi:hypothetical protein
MKKNPLFKNFLSLLVALSFIFISFGQAQAIGLGDWGKNLNDAAGQSGAGFKTDVNDPSVVIGVVIQFALSFVGVIFLLLMIYGGYLWMTARGEEQTVNKAKDLIRAAIIGLIIIILAYSISFFVISKVSQGTMSNGGSGQSCWGDECGPNGPN